MDWCIKVRKLPYLGIIITNKRRSAVTGFIFKSIDLVLVKR